MTPVARLVWRPVQPKGATGHLTVAAVVPGGHGKEEAECACDELHREDGHQGERKGLRGSTSPREVDADDNLWKNKSIS